MLCRPPWLDYMFGWWERAKLADDGEDVTCTYRWCCVLGEDDKEVDHYRWEN